MVAMAVWQGYYLGCGHKCQGCWCSLHPGLGVKVIRGRGQLVDSGSVVKSWTTGVASHGTAEAWLAG